MRRLLATAPEWLGRRGLPAASVLLALVLVSPSLRLRLVADDYVHLARLSREARVPGFGFAPLDLFSFASGDPAQREALMAEGAFAWWTAPDFRLAFWRPLSSLTHVLDFRLRPGSALWAHAHSLLWFAALLAVVAVLYRRFHLPWIAHLALLLYALDDARGVVVSWPANRNALVAATLAFGALVAHDRARREAWRPGAWLAPALFAVALLGGEAALAVAAYLFAHALFLDQGPLGRRLARLGPFAVVGGLWLAAYRTLGYGTRGGGLYVDPAGEPLRFLGAVGERLPLLLAAQLGPVPSDLWSIAPGWARLLLYGLAVATLAAAALVSRPLLRREPVCRFWALGGVLSLLPVCASFPMDRLLVFAGVGAMAVVAMLIAEAQVRRAWGIAVPLLVLVHLVLAPLLLPARALTLEILRTAHDRVDAAIPKDEGVRAQLLLIVNAPVDGFVAYSPIERAVRGVPRPRGQRLLSTGLAAVQVSRPDAGTLRLRPGEGFLARKVERMMRGDSPRFRAGDRVVLEDLRVRVVEVTADGRPAEVDFAFAVPLEDPSLLWRQWRAGTLVPYAPPAVGASERLPALERGGWGR